MIRAALIASVLGLALLGAGCGKEDELTPAYIVETWQSGAAQYQLAQRLHESKALIGLSEGQARALLVGAQVDHGRYPDNDDPEVSRLYWAHSCSGSPECFALRAKFVNSRLVSTDYQNTG